MRRLQRMRRKGGREIGDEQTVDVCEREREKE